MIRPILVDSSVLLDLFTQDPVWYDRSAAILEREAERSVLIINPIVYAEASVRFERIEEFEEAVPAGVFRRDPIPWEAAFLVGKCFTLYRRRGGQRRSPLPDFFIGAHAAIRGYRLLTRDEGSYRSYFPKLAILSP